MPWIGDFTLLYLLKPTLLKCIKGWNKDLSCLQKQSVEAGKAAMVGVIFSLCSKMVLHFQQISPRSVRPLLPCKLHMEGSGRISLVPRGFMFSFFTEA